MTKPPRATARCDGPLERQPLDEVVDAAERRHILSVLDLARGNRAEAARVLGISRKTLWKKLRRLGLHAPHVTER